MKWGKLSALLAFILLALSLASCASPDQPLGGLLHRYDVTTPASGNSKTELLLRFEAGQQAAVAIIPSENVRISFVLWGPGIGNVVDRSHRVIDWTAPTPGTAYLQEPFIAPGSGTYLLDIMTLSGQGTVRVVAVPRGVLEAESFCCKTHNNDTIAAAQNLDGYFWATVPGTERAAVFGEFHGALDNDNYKFPVKAGETISLAAAGSTSTAPQLTLFEDGNPVAESVTDPINPQERIDGYTAGSDTQLTVEVTGPAETTYGLVVIRNGILEKESNHSAASAMLLPGDDGSTGVALTGPKAIYGSTGEVVPHDLDVLEPNYVNAPFSVDINPATATFGAPNGLLYNSAPVIQLVGDGNGSSGPLNSFTVQYDEDGYVENGDPSPLGLQTFHNTPAAGQLQFEGSALKSGTQQIISQYSVLNPLFVSRMMSWREGQNVLQVTYLFKNSNDKAMKDVAFVETIDPAPGGEPQTHNVYSVGENGQTVTAWNGQGAMLIGSGDPRVVFGIGTGGVGKDVLDARQVFAAPAQQCGDPCPPASDEAVSIAFNIGVIPARSQTQVTYLITVGNGQSDTMTAYDQAQPLSLVDSPIDVFSLPLLAGQYVEAYVGAPGSPDGMPYNILNPALRIMGPDGSQFLYNDDAGGSTNAKLAFTVTPEQAGRYTLRVEPALTGRHSYDPKYINGGEYVMTLWVHNQPKFEAIANPSINRGKTLSLAVLATDADLPADTLTYSLISGPTGAQINPQTGVLTWAVPANQALGSYAVTLMVKDTTKPNALWDKTTINITVLPDDEAPVTMLLATPQSVTRWTDAHFTFSGQDNLTPANALKYECKLDDAEFTACNGTYTGGALPMGQHTFTVRAIDADGNVDPQPPTYQWSVGIPHFIPITISSGMKVLQLPLP